MSCNCCCAENNGEFVKSSICGTHQGNLGPSGRVIYDSDNCPSVCTDDACTSAMICFSNYGPNSVTLTKTNGAGGTPTYTIQAGQSRTLGLTDICTLEISRATAAPVCICWKGEITRKVC